MRTDRRIASKFYYKLIPEGDVSPSRRRIAAEVIDRAVARMPFRCPRPRISWYREGNIMDFSFIEDTSLAGQAVLPLGKGDDAIALRVSAEHRTVEELVRTVAHEMKHVYHLAHFRPPSTAERDAMEHDAFRFEGLVWNDWVAAHGDTVGPEANMLALKWWAGEA